MSVVYKDSGGTVVKVAERRWEAFAPDGRPVGRFPTLRQAKEKVQHWGKWDAFDSLAEVFANMAPLTFLLTTQMLLTMTDEKPSIPTEEQMIAAVIFDYLIMLGREYPEILGALKEKPELVQEIIDKVKETKREGGHAQR